MKHVLFGPDAELSDLAEEIMAEDLDALSRRLASGWDINRTFLVCKYLHELPIAVALSQNKLRVLDFLLDNGVDLNAQEAPAIVCAVRNCGADVVEMLVRRGAAIDRFNRVGVSAYSAALYSKRFDLLPVLLKLGLRVDVDNGVCLRQAVFGGQFEAVRFFVENGLDPNLRAPDSVFPYNPTAVAIAAENGHVEMVKYLVEHGADVSLRDEHSERPYSLAAKRGHEELSAYLRSLEDPCLHDIEHRTLALKFNGLPAEVIEFLRGSSLRIELGDTSPRFLQFYDVLGVKVMKWEKRTILDLVSEVDDYCETGFLVWSPRDRKLAHADYEHREFRVLCGWEEFLSNPRRWIDAIFE